MTTDPIAEWYYERAAQAKAAAEELDKAKAEGKPKEEIARLEWALELARYVGD
jgi:hypothetical protein